MGRRIWSSTTALALVLAPTLTFANAEPPALHDARSTGMGGTGVAFIDSGAAVYHNPASLDEIGNLALTLGVTPLFPTTEAPFGGPGSERVSTTPLVPLFFVGGGVRVSDLVTVGLGIYTQSGIGGRFESVDELGGNDVELNIGVVELSVPVSFRLAADLSLGVALRMAYVQLDSESPDPGGAGMVRQEMGGFGFPGFHVGLNWQPSPLLRLALTYRSKMSIDLDGDIELPGAGAVDGTSEWPIEHSIRVGGALSLLDEVLLLALEFKVQFYDESHNTLMSTANIGGVEVDNPLQLDWKTSYGFQFGAEYQVTSALAARLGYAMSMSSVPDETATAFAPPPGLLHAITGGVGVDVGEFELGAAASYTIAAATLDQPSVNGSPGDYRQTGLFVALSATYRN